MTGSEPSPRERRIGLRLAARREEPLVECLLRLRGRAGDERFTLGALRAVGGEGAIYDVTDRDDPGAPLVAKIPLAAWHRPVHLTSKLIARRRKIVLDEAAALRDIGSPFLPAFRALAHFANPLLEAARGGEFAKPEPCLVMERLPGQDLDAWLCRVHRGGVARKVLRPSLDRIAVGLVQALTDLERRGWIYADLRPNNLRVLGRPLRRIRVLDAGGLVRADDPDARFPHVPSYLPPRLFRAVDRGEEIHPSVPVQAAMAGRTLFEVATGHAPQAGTYVDMEKLARSPISPPVALVIASLANGDYPDCAGALAALAEKARKRR